MIASSSGRKHDGDSDDADDDADDSDDDDDDGDDDDDDDDDALPHTCFTDGADLRPFVEQVPHTCGADASQASMTICRSYDHRPIKCKTPGLQRALSPHLEPPSVVGSTEHGKSSYSKGCRHIVGYMLIRCLSMSDIKAYIFASYDISASPSGSRCSHREAA